MVECRIPQAIDAVVSLLANAGMTVYDGPILTGNSANSAVFIGYDADPEGDQQASSTQQAWAGVGVTRKRDEENQIAGAVVVLFGDSITAWKNVRDLAYGLLDTIGQTLRANADLGLSAPSVAELWPGDYFQEATTAGYQGRLVFSIHYKTRV